MASILQSLNRTVIVGIVVALVVFIIMSMSNGGFDYDQNFWSAFFRYLHVLSGIMWIGLLWYFNFVQIPNMPNIPDEQKPAIGKVIAPAALFWFRWAALSTIITGLIVSYLSGYITEALSFGLLTNGAAPKSISIGIGMWLGIIMAYNVWMVIWPNQKKALGIIEASAEEKAKSARTAMLFSRTNTLLSIPMLLTMVSAQNLY
ncbi:urate hydroxylase PuuD [Alphaproteobacteria bacterium]|nr:urate hydroxylase PuuD [Alphaproteobacteria bacterium]